VNDIRTAKASKPPYETMWMCETTYIYCSPFAEPDSIHTPIQLPPTSSFTPHPTPTTANTEQHQISHHTYLSSPTHVSVPYSSYPSYAQTQPSHTLPPLLFSATAPVCAPSLQSKTPSPSWNCQLARHGEVVVEVFGRTLYPRPFYGVGFGLCVFLCQVEGVEVVHYC
jgi:hypothetical protein